jgi:hypothetical protein
MKAEAQSSHAGEDIDSDRFGASTHP